MVEKSDPSDQIKCVSGNLFRLIRATHSER